MSEDEIKNGYFEWILCRVGTKDRDPAGYSELLRYLDSVGYIYTIPMDGNRADDGICLRYRYGSENGISPAVISSVLDIRDCSMLEMAAALAIRCEEDVMYDPQIGDRTGIWFWIMIDSLGLGEMTDGHFNREAADGIILAFLEHRYEPNGQGSLFRITEEGTGGSSDLRRMELWNQMGVFLTSGVYI